MTADWAVLKFGGSSLADADTYRAVGSIVVNSPHSLRAVVVSASAGVTDQLIEAVATATEGGPYQGAIDQIRERHAGIASELLSPSTASTLEEAMAGSFEDVNDVLRAASVMGSAQEHVTDTVASFGELWSAQILAAYLGSLGHEVSWLDARSVLTVEPTGVVPAVDWASSRKKLEEWMSANQARTIVITGYRAVDPSGAPTTLGRNGSDYSAAVFASLLDASEIVLWTDVDGVMSADPQLVPQAQVIGELSYNEAMELAYFGARVLHPATMNPAVAGGIPISIRNTFNPSGSGTRILSESDDAQPVKGFASIDAMTLVNIEGSAMIGVPGIAERLFGALRNASVSVVLISQASSEHSICFAVPDAQATTTKRVAEDAFASERDRGRISDVELTPACTILAAVGDGMSGIPGIAARFLGSVASAGVNVKAIAQGSSERNISIVIDGSDAAKALRSAHAAFYLSRRTISIGLIGPGHVGSALLNQLGRQQDRLRDELAVDLRVRAVATSSRMMLDEHQLDLASWKERLDQSEHVEMLDLDRLVECVQTDSVPHAAIIDCTASDDVAGRYDDWLSRGIHVVTPNKKANSGDLLYYQRLQQSSRRADAHYFYETTVGAALPVIQTLRDLVQTGDEIYRIEGILSGTLSYLFNSFDGSRPFSEIVADAHAAGYTEPDPREDLSGMDVARKVVILAREMGLNVGLNDVNVEGLVPHGLEEGPVEAFLDQLQTYDTIMLERIQTARQTGEVLRFVGTIDPENGCEVSLQSFPSDHAFAQIQLTDNIVLFRTARYSDNPLVVQGPGAGPEVTAAGVFADLLRLANYLGATF